MADRYWVGGTADWDGTAGTKWSTTSGGAGGASVPGLTDNVFFNAASGAGTVTVPAAVVALSNNLTFTGFTGTLAGPSGANISAAGSVTLASGMALTFAGTLTMTGAGTTLTSNGKFFNGGLTINAPPGGSVTLLDAFTSNSSSSSAIALNGGTFALGSFTATLASFSSGFRADITTATRVLSTGTGALVIAGIGGFSASSTGFTCTGTGTISLTSGSVKTFAGGGVQTYPTINQGGGGTLTITGSNKFADITNTYAATGATTVQFVAGEVNEFTAFNLTGLSLRVCTLKVQTFGQTTLKKSTPWLVGLNSIDSGNNSGLTFANGGGIDYLNISYINGQGSSAAGSGSFFAFF